MSTVANAVFPAEASGSCGNEREEVGQGERPGIAAQQPVDDRALHDVVREVEEERQRRIALRGGAERFELFAQPVAVGQQQLARAGALGLVRNQRGEGRAHEGAGVGREPVQQGLDDPVARRSELPRFGHPHVLLGGASHGKTQPRVVGDVVVAHLDGVARVGGLEAEAQVAAHRRAVLQRGAGAALRPERADAVEQDGVAALVQLEVSGGDERCRLGVVGHPLAAAAGPLQFREEGIEPAHILVGVAFVPGAQRQQRHQVEQVVVEQDGERHRIGRVLPTLPDDEVEHVHGDGVVVDPVGHAVPVVEGVQPFGARARVVVGHRSAQVEAPAADVPHVGAHALAQTQQPVLEIPRAAGVRQDVGTHVQHGPHELADVGKGDVLRLADTGGASGRLGHAVTARLHARVTALSRLSGFLVKRRGPGPLRAARGRATLARPPPREVLMLVRILPLTVAALLTIVPVAAQAQLRATLIAGGFERPNGVVLDPVVPGAVYVVEQIGTVRAFLSGVERPQLFLDLRGSISGGFDEQGLLGLAFPPDAATTGRVFVHFTNPSGNSVIRRYTRDSANPMTVDPASAFDLQWPAAGGGRQGFISQPFANHNGGHLAFGPDGYLYIGLGDGGGGDDPQNNAQNPATLLGKMLRLDVSGNPQFGYSIPPTNPVPAGNSTFTGINALPEIWAFGLRNPWRYGFDDLGPGNTGALVIGDVGQGAREEIDYEPAGAGGRNYGWRVYEGTRENIPEAPAYSPLTGPVAEYSHAVGQAITGGYVYRGAALGAVYQGRYFYADCVQGKVFSVGLNVDPGTGEATAGSTVEHTIEMGGPFGCIAAFTRDTAGELYFMDFDPSANPGAGHGPHLPHRGGRPGGSGRARQPRRQRAGQPRDLQLVGPSHRRQSRQLHRRGRHRAGPGQPRLGVDHGDVACGQRRPDRAVLRAGPGPERPGHERTQCRRGRQRRLHPAARAVGLHHVGGRHDRDVGLGRGGRHDLDGHRRRFLRGHDRPVDAVCGAGGRHLGDQRPGRHLLPASPGGERVRHERAVDRARGGRRPVARGLTGWGILRR